MNLKSQKILGIDVNISTKTEILEEMRKYLGLRYKIQDTRYKKKVKPLIIYTPNPEIITYAQKDETFVRIVNSAQINLPDGAGVVWALKTLYGIKVQKLSGIDFMLELVKLAEKESLTIGLIGGRGGVADKTAECLQSDYPSLKVEVFEAPEVEISKIKNQKSKIHIKDQRDKDTSDGGRLSLRSHDSSEVEESEDRYFISLVNEIRDRKISILFVAMGHPKQEYFIEYLKEHLKDNIKQKNNPQPTTHNPQPIILMSVGGAFDYISGGVSRAPKWMRNNMELEWFYRLFREPWRLPRMIKGGEFFLRVAFSSIFPIKYP